MLGANYAGCMVEGRNATPISELLEAEEAKRAGLRDVEVIALRLYSGNIPSMRLCFIPVTFLVCDLKTMYSVCWCYCV